jgi:hypothetical protein
MNISTLKDKLTRILNQQPSTKHSRVFSWFKPSSTRELSDEIKSQIRYVINNYNTDLLLSSKFVNMNRKLEEDKIVLEIEGQPFYYKNVVEAKIIKLGTLDGVNGDYNTEYVFKLIDNDANLSPLEQLQNRKTYAREWLLSKNHILYRINQYASITGTDQQVMDGTLDIDMTLPGKTGGKRRKSRKNKKRTSKRHRSSRRK